jgi:hypothetical protein
MNLLPELDLSEAWTLERCAASVTSSALLFLLCCLRVTSLLPLTVSLISICYFLDLPSSQHPLVSNAMSSLSVQRQALGVGVAPQHITTLKSQ